MLHRIVALLLSLADLAERAASRSHVVRRIVLWLLYPAESAARKLALDAFGPVPLPEVRMAFSDDSVAEALRLAACLRLLAAMLANMSAEDIWEHLPRVAAALTPALGDPLALSGLMVVHSKISYQDTS